MNEDKYLTITSLTKYLKNKFDSDIHLNNIYLKGEVSNFKAHSTGHMYFSLKDKGSKINAIMFARQASSLQFKPVEGSNVFVRGRISIYEATGQYQIYVEEMLEDGMGNLHILFEKLKKELNDEGLFREEHKKEIPKIPETVGVVTAPTGAAVRDIISTIRRRYPLTKIILFPSLVQGDNAAADIAYKIKIAEKFNIDTLIVGRGGGSIEDMWPFNEEIVARAIFNSNIPIISAVGHEVDFTIADFVSDLRAPTPTAAAEIAVPNIVEVNNNIKQLNIRLNEVMIKKVRFEKLKLDSIKNSFVIKNPKLLYENKKQDLINITEKLNRYMFEMVSIRKQRLDVIKSSIIFKDPKRLYVDYKVKLANIINNLEILNPLDILSRGYSLVYRDNHIIRDIKDVKINDTLNIKLFKGNINVEVKEIVNE